MSTPRVTADGIKVTGTGNDWRCGQCGAFLANTWGFAKDGMRCTNCGTQNRPDFGLDLASERLAALAVHLERSSRKFDSMEMAYAAEELRFLVTDVRHLEEIDRTVLGGPEPLRTPPSFPPEFTEP